MQAANDLVSRLTRRIIPGLSLSLIAIVWAGAVPARELAVYKGAGCDGAARLAEFEAFLGRRVDRVVDFMNAESVEQAKSGLRWGLGCWRDAGRKVILSVVMVPKGGSLAQAADGAYDDLYRDTAQTLVAYGQRDAVLRLGWEFNGDWYPWAAANDPKNFVKAWIRAVRIMRGVSPAFRFDWNPALGKDVNPAATYPGDAYVDVIGLDVYNFRWGVKNVKGDDIWNGLVSAEYGLEWHRTFARAHGKPMSFPEWGTGLRAEGFGGGDDPVFVERMARWIADNNVMYTGYWDYPATDFNGLISTGRMPNAARAFQRLFGGRKG